MEFLPQRPFGSFSRQDAAGLLKNALEVCTEEAAQPPRSAGARSPGTARQCRGGVLRTGKAEPQTLNPKPQTPKP